MTTHHPLPLHLLPCHREKNAKRFRSSVPFEYWQIHSAVLIRGFPKKVNKYREITTSLCQTFIINLLDQSRKTLINMIVFTSHTALINTLVFSLGLPRYSSHFCSHKRSWCFVLATIREIQLLCGWQKLTVTYF